MILVLAAAGCSGAPGSFDDPIPVMTNVNVHDKTRQAAAKQAELANPTDPRRIAALYELTWVKGVEDYERVYAFEQLEKYDGENFRTKIARRVPAMVDWLTIKAVFDIAVKNKWSEFTPIVVQQYARPARGIVLTERPERGYLVKLNPGKTPEEVIFSVFVDTDKEWNTVQQVAAWTLLCRLMPRETLMNRLQSVQARTALVADLQAAAKDLGTVPTNREGVLWLMDWRAAKNAPAWWSWAKAKDVCTNLRPEQKAGLEMRHIPLLMRAQNSPSLRLSRQELYTKLLSMIPTEGHYVVSPSYDGQPPDYPQRISEYQKQLVWADLYVIYTAMSMMRNQPLALSQVFEIIDRDVADTSTEYGGVVTWKDDDISKPIEEQTLVVRYIPPALRDHDRKYVASDDLMNQVYYGFAHFHMHAQYYNNSDWAGPGRGDLDFADRTGLNCLLFTSIRKNIFNTDYYQPGRVVVDLGSVAR